MPTVAVVKCGSYEPSEVSRSVKKGIDLLGGLEALFTPGIKLLLKPNILVGDPPEKSVTTHPALLASISSLLLDKNFRVTYGDSPGFGKMIRAAQRSGIRQVFDKMGVPPADFESVEYVSHPEGVVLKKIPLARGVLEADTIISVSKMKTHGFTRITGAVKNQFGCIPGLLKGEFHVKMPDIKNFSAVLHDINHFLKPGLFIMDGIVAMEGNGPRGGSSIKMNTLLFSRDPVALDLIFCKLIDLNPEFVPTIRYSSYGEAGIGYYDNIDLVGDNIDELINPEFKVVRKPFERFGSAEKFPVFLKNLISPKPEIDYDSCANCGHCVLQCPTEPKSVNWREGSRFKFPVYNYSSCIRCYCCQEICPHNSISIKTPFLGKLIKR